MTPKSAPSVFASVVLAYRDLATVTRALPRLAGMAVAAFMALDLVAAYLLPWGPDDGNPAVLAAFIVGLAQTFVILPFLVAVHRFIILGEAAAHYAFAPRLQPYFLWWAAMSVAATAPGFLPAIFAGPDSAGPVAVVTLAYLMALMVFYLRVTLLFPAIAVDAAGAQWRNAAADAKGHFWRILAIMVLVGIPPWLAYLLVLKVGFSSAPTGLVSTLLRSLLSLVSVVQFVVIASRLYQQLADRLTRAA